MVDFINSTIAVTLQSEFSSLAEEVSVNEVARYFGGRRGYQPDGKTCARIRECIKETSSIIEPVATYSLFTVSTLIPGKEVVLDNGLKLVLPECYSDTGTKMVAAIIGSLGEGLEEHCRKLAGNGDFYESTLFDAVGTVMLDLISEKICNIIGTIGDKHGLSRGPRFAPGIEGYPLEQQFQLFEMADNESVGVRLNSSAIMIPTKSVSFFAMLTDSPGIIETKNKCSTCLLKNCQFRNISS